jgi:Mrp family chromosome partitioning ATPase
MSQTGASEPPRAATAWLLAAVVGGFTFAAFAGYAFLTPAVYRTSALIEVWASDDKAASKLEPLEASRRLHEAVLDSVVLERLAEERAPGAAAETKSQLARVIESALQIDTLDARTFTVSFRDSERARTESSCNWLAERAVERAPRALASDTSAQDRLLEAERRRRANAVAAFLAAHPELAALRPAASSGAPAGDDTALLMRRLTELNADVSAGAAPAASTGKPSEPATVSAEVRQMFAELVRARDASKAAPAHDPPLKARLVSRASLPGWPVEPDRPRLLLIGLLAAFGSAALAAFLGRRRGGEFGDSTPPPGLSSYPPGAATSSYPPPAGASSPPPPVAQAAGSSEPPNEKPRLPPAASPPPPEDKGQPIIPSRVVSPRPPAPEPARTSVSPANEARGSARFAPGDRNEGDRITPVSAYPPPPGPAQGERGLRVALEVNAGAPAAEKRSSSPPAVRGQSARTTHVLGSPIPPIIAPGSRRLPSVGSGEQPAAPASTTGYSYVSSAPPNAGPSSRPRVSARPSQREGAQPYQSNGPPTRRFASVVPDAQDSSLVSVQRVPSGWRADLSLLPESRRNLCDEIYPFAVDNCCVVGVLGGADTADVKSRLAAELGLALAESGHTRVLLLEGDLERSSVKRFLRVDMPMNASFSQQMKARVAGGGASPWTVVECSPSLHVLAEGAESTPELILSQAFEDCLRELRSFYDFIVIDGPLLANVSACRAVRDVVDRVVFSHGRFGPSELQQAKVLFPDKRISVVPAFG